MGPSSNQRFLWLDRYSQSNIHSLGQHKAYSADIPPYLHDKPRPFVLHSLERLTSASNITSSMITQTATDNHFTIRGSGDEQYIVNMMSPTCTCYDWHKFGYPCKHMFAVCQLYHCSLPDHYINNVWYRLDEHIVTQMDTVDVSEPQIPDDDSGDAIAATDCQPDCDEEMPLKKAGGAKMFSGTIIREMLSQISSLTYLIPETALVSVKRDVQNLLNTVDNLAPKSKDGFKKEKPRAVTNTVYRTKRLKRPLPDQHLPAKVKRSKWSGRVGKVAELHKPAGTTITLSL